MKETLYRKYRPSNFDGFFGNQGIATALKNSIQNSSLSHAYLFAGSRGLGKTSMARLLVRGFGCQNLIEGYNPCTKCESCLSIGKGSWIDMVEIDAASNRGIDEIRSLREKVGYLPQMGSKKFYIIDEVHMLTREAFNALLKTIEEPPSHVVFILATTELERVPSTIVSRCQTYKFQPITDADISKRLEEVAQGEDVKISKDAVDLICDEAGGSLRDAISIMERIFSTFMGENIDGNKARKAIGLVSEEEVDRFYETILNNRVEDATAAVDNIHLKGGRIDVFLRQVASHAKKRSPLGFAIDVMDNIYSVMNQFKYEDDKRILGYIAIGRITSSKDVVKGEGINTPVKKKVEKESEIEVESKALKRDEVKGEGISSTEKKGDHNKITLTLENLKDCWDKIRKNIKKEKYSLFHMLRYVRPKAIEGSDVVLEIKGEDQFIGQTLREEENLKILKNYLGDFFEGKLGVKIDVEDNQSEDKKIDDLGIEAVKKEMATIKEGKEKREKDQQLPTEGEDSKVKSTKVASKEKAKNSNSNNKNSDVEDDEFAKKIAEIFTRGL